jgi:hypothetical protein
VLSLLDPLLALVIAKLRIQGEFELQAVIHAVVCAHITKDKKLVLNCCNWLIGHRPIPLFAVELCLRGLVACPDGLPNRLRLEHPGDFQAALLAVLVERELLDRPDLAIDALAALATTASTDEDKDAICSALLETCGRCGLARIQQALHIVSSLRPLDSRLRGLLTAAQYFASNDLGSARKELEAIRDEMDGVWWQAYAQLCEKEGDDDSAQKAWERASETLPHPDVVRRSVQASLKQKEFHSVIRGAKTLLAA